MEPKVDNKPPHLDLHLYVDSANYWDRLGRTKKLFFKNRCLVQDINKIYCTQVSVNLFFVKKLWETFKSRDDKLIKYVFKLLLINLLSQRLQINKTNLLITNQTNYK